MHRTALLFAAITFVLVSAAALFLANRAVDILEDDTRLRVETALQAAGQSWATIRPDGLRVNLTGLAPDEASRFRAIEIMGEVIDSDRIDDLTTVLTSADLSAPRFTLEMLRNTDRISLIGLIPASVGRDQIMDRAREVTQGGPVTDMLESAEHSAPISWAQNLSYGLYALELLSLSKISISPEAVTITAVTTSHDERQRLERKIIQAKPDRTVLNMDISAPRQVISPFRFRMSLFDGMVRLSACSADTRATRDRILRGVKRAGEADEPTCQIGLGVPTTEWDIAVLESIDALAELGGGTLSLTDSDIALVANEDTTQTDFDRIIGKLENDLPELFSLQAVLPPKILKTGEVTEVEQPEFTANLAPDGTLKMQGRLPSDLAKTSVSAFAAGLFGKNGLRNQTRIDEHLPDGWTVRVLAALEALSELHHGSAMVQPKALELSGVAAQPDASSEVTRILSIRLDGLGGTVIDVTHDASLVPTDDTLSPEICELRIKEALDGGQIAFAPSSASIEAQSAKVLDTIADLLIQCPDARFEVEGHTDSQGREEMNRALSQTRADAVLAALLSRRVPITNYSARGFGEAQPIADNETEEGRAQNRRINFRLIREDALDAEAAALAEAEAESGAEAIDDAETPQQDDPTDDATGAEE